METHGILKISDKEKEAEKEKKEQDVQEEGTQQNVFKDLYENATDYVDLQIKSFKLEIYERVTSLISSGINAALIIIFSLFCYMFLNIGLAVWLGDVFKSYALGFVTVGGVNMLFVVLYLFFDNVIIIDKTKNAIFQKLSKTKISYEEMMEEQAKVHTEIDSMTQKIENNIETIKSKVMLGKHPELKLSRMVLAKSAFYVSKFMFRNSGPLQRLVYPWIVDKVANTLVINEPTIKTSIKGFVTDIKNRIRGKKPMELAVKK